MNISRQRKYDRFKRSAAYIDQIAGEFAPGAKALGFRDELQAVVTSLDDVANTPAPVMKANQTANSQKRDALNALREELGAIERTASAIAAADPKFKNSFVLPDRRRKEELVATARTFLKKAAPVKAKFREYEMQPDFLEGLQSSLDAYVAFQAGKGQGRAKKTKEEGAGDAVSALIAEGDRLANVLDVVLGNKYRDEPEKLDAWRVTSALEKGTRKKKDRNGK